MNEDILEQLKDRRARLSQAIAALEGDVLKEAARDYSRAVAQEVLENQPKWGRSRKASTGRRGISAEGRKKISDAMKKRWAQRRREAK